MFIIIRRVTENGFILSWSSEPKGKSVNSVSIYHSQLISCFYSGCFQVSKRQSNVSDGQTVPSWTGPAYNTSLSSGWSCIPFFLCPLCRHVPLSFCGQPSVEISNSRTRGQNSLKLSKIGKVICSCKQTSTSCQLLNQPAVTSNCALVQGTFKFSNVCQGSYFQRKSVACFWLIVAYFCHTLECFGYVFGIRWATQLAYRPHLHIYIEEILESPFFLESQSSQVPGPDPVATDN